MTDDDQPPKDPDPKVKDLLSASDVADLQRWFGLPSFEQLGDAAPTAPPTAAHDPEMAASIVRRDAALAAVDPRLLEELAVRESSLALPTMRFVPNIELALREDTPLIDLVRAERGVSVLEPREVEIPDQLIEDLGERTPQALLRDLHRPELEFMKEFEIIDPIAELRVDASAEVKLAIATRYDEGMTTVRVPAEARALFNAAIAQHMFRWTDVLQTPLANRRVSES